MVDLGGLVSSSYSLANAVNDSGQVVGCIAVLTTPTSAPCHAFSWTQLEFIDLGTLGGASSHAGAVNASGQIVGSSDTAGNGVAHAFSWTRAGGMIDLGTPGGTYSAAAAVNDSGQVVGTARDPFSWTQAGGMIDLGNLGGSVISQGGPVEGASAVNNSGQVVGYSAVNDVGNAHAFSWTRAGGMIDLGTLGGADSGAAAVNASGQVVGFARPPGNAYHAVLWNVPSQGPAPTSCNGGPSACPLKLGHKLGGGSPTMFCWVCFGKQVLMMIWPFPIDASTGNFFHSFQDFSIPGRGVPLSLSRTYNSMAATSDSPFGFGWSFDYSMSLTFPDTTDVVVNEENGAQFAFTKQADGSYRAAPRFAGTLVHNTDGSWTFTRRARDAFGFDSSGRLTSQVDLNGYVTSLAYSSGGQLATITDPEGRKLTFTSNGSHVATVTDPLGRTMSYAYDASGNLTDVTDVAGGNTHFTYDGSHRMLTMRWPNQAPGVPGSTGSVITNTYDSQGRVATQSDQLGRTTTFDYTSIANSTKITDPKGNVTVQTYQFGLLVSQTLGYGTPQAAMWTFTYDPATLGVTDAVDPNGHHTKSSYDAQGNRLTLGDGLGRTTTNTYDPLNDLLTTMDPLGVTTTMSYDAHGNALSRARPLAGTPQVQVTTYSYGDAAHPGDVTSMTDPDGKVWSYTYDADIDLASTTDPVGDRTTSANNAIGWRLTTVSPRGNVAGQNPANFTTTYTYNSFGQLTTTTNPEASAPGVQGDINCSGHVDYVDAVQILRVAAGLSADANCMALGDVNCDGAVDPVDALLELAYDAGIPASSATALSANTAQNCPPIGSVVGSPTSSATYDPDRNLISSTDADGNKTAYVYNAADEQTVTQRADGTTTQTRYWPDGTVKDQIDGAGVITHYDYDALARQSAITDPLGRVSSYTYDGAGNETRATNAQGQVTTMAYDAANQQTGTAYSDGTTPNVTNITYDADGQRTGMTDGSGAWSWTWDSLHRLTSVTEGSNGTVAYTYNLRDLVTGIIYPGSLTVSRGYDDAGRWTSVQDWLGNTTTFGYDADSNLVTEQLPPTTLVSDSFLFDRADRLMGITDSGSSGTFFSAEYQRDANGQLTFDSSAPSAVHSYGYTALNQLCYAGSSTTKPCASPPAKSIDYSYNTADNIVQDGHTSQAFDAANELCWTASPTTASGTCAAPPAGSTTYSYDPRGNRTGVTPSTGTPTTLGYDQTDRLSSFVQGTTTASYTYNGSGLRMSKTVGGTTTNALWEGSGGLPLQIMDGSVAYVFGPGGMPLEQISGSTTLWYHHDQIGSTRAITDSTGATKATYTFDPYGNLTASTGSMTNPFLFSGQRRDSESGLYYLRARYYDPATAQFITRDSMLSLTRSAYAYVTGNPLSWTDPTGLGAPHDPGSGLVCGFVGLAPGAKGIVGAVAGTACGSAGGDIWGNVLCGVIGLAVGLVAGPGAGPVAGFVFGLVCGSGSGSARDGPTAFYGTTYSSAPSGDYTSKKAGLENTMRILASRIATLQSTNSNCGVPGAELNADIEAYGRDLWMLAALRGPIPPRPGPYPPQP